MSKKKIGVFGGSFDPPTLAHEKIGQLFLEKIELDEVRFVPVFKNPIKQNYPINSEHRLNMLSMIVGSCDKFSLSDIELQSDYEYDMNYALIPSERTPSYTYNTLRMFKENEHQAEFIFLGGSDILSKFYQWHKAESLLKEFNIGIAVRAPHNQSSTLSPIKPSDRKRITVIEHSTPQISSTDVRKFIQDKEFDKARKLLREDVFEYIVNNNLYSM
jgi:nicotinate-nucleotide adenylyltransferase